MDNCGNSEAVGDVGDAAGGRCTEVPINPSVSLSRWAEMIPGSRPHR